MQGQILAAQARMAEAGAAYDEAVEILDKLGSRVELGRVAYGAKIACPACGWEFVIESPAQSRSGAGQGRGAGDEPERLLLPTAADEDRRAGAADRLRRADGLGQPVVGPLVGAVVVTGTPSSGPVGSPFRQRSVEAFATARAPSESKA